MHVMRYCNGIIGVAMQVCMLKVWLCSKGLCCVGAMLHGAHH